MDNPERINFQKTGGLRNLGAARGGYEICASKKKKKRKDMTREERRRGSPSKGGRVIPDLPRGTSWEEGKYNEGGIFEWGGLEKGAEVGEAHILSGPQKREREKKRRRENAGKRKSKLSSPPEPQGVVKPLLNNRRISGGKGTKEVEEGVLSEGERGAPWGEARP